MLRIPVDMNLREDDRTIVILPGSIPAERLVVGTRVVLYEPDGDIECEAIVRRGETWEWVADIVEGTIKDTRL